MLDKRLQKTGIENDDWILGDPDAPVPVLEYADMECPYCGAARAELEALVAGNPELVKLVYRHFPLTTIHPHAEVAAEAAEAAGAQGRFWEMHDLIFTNQRHLEYPDLLVYAEEVSIDVERFDREMRARRYASEVKKDFRRGVLDGVNGTPTIFLNGVRYDGPRDRDSMLAAIAMVTGAARFQPGMGVQELPF